MLGNASYPTYQAFLALGIAALITIVLMPLWIKILKYESIGQQVRADGPKRHLVKQGTPTMGGVVILIAIVLTCLIMAKHTTEMLLVLIATVATGVLGLIDDLTSVTHGRSLGLTPHAKMFGLTLICIIFCLGAVNFCGVSAEVRFPGGFAIDLSVLQRRQPYGRPGRTRRRHIDDRLAYHGCHRVSLRGFQPCYLWRCCCGWMPWLPLV